MPRKKKSTEPIRVQWSIHADTSGEWLIPREDWDGITERTRNAMLDDMLQTEIGNHLDAGFKVIED